jgi:signal transduction histidine kinase
LLDQTLDQVKAISTELRPGVLDKFGLAAAIEWQCQEFERRTGISYDCELPATLSC